MNGQGCPGRKSSGGQAATVFGLCFHLFLLAAQYEPIPTLRSHSLSADVPVVTGWPENNI